jgi:hypothetical protein
MMIFLASRQGAIIHSAGWCLDGGGFVFAGKSGAGKSTISNLIDQAGTGLILSDDRIVVRKIDDQFFIYGTPWPGESGIAVNQSAPLKGILFLKQGNENRIADLKSSDAMSYLFPVMSIPWHDRENVSHMMDFCESLLSIIPMYELTFCADETAADFVNEFIDG